MGTGRARRSCWTRDSERSNHSFCNCTMSSRFLMRSWATASLRPCVRSGLIRRFRPVRVGRQEDKDPVALTLLDPLHRKLPLGDPSVQSG